MGTRLRLGEEGVLGLHGFFFFNDPATTEIYTLSLHDALPISRCVPRSTSSPTSGAPSGSPCACWWTAAAASCRSSPTWRSEEHTSELQSQSNLVCRLLLEKKTQLTPHLLCGARRARG